MAAKRILVVDDHRDSAEIFVELLAVLGHHAVAVIDPRDAIGVAKQFHPHIAILDLGMPRIHGLELAKMFRADPAFAGICLVALTAYDDEEHRHMTRQAGFDAHVAKPADQHVMRAILAQFGAD